MAKATVLKQEDIVDIVNKYKSGKFNLRVLAKEYKVGTSRIKNILSDYNVKLNKAGKQNATVGFENEIIDRYIKGMTIDSIVKEYKTNHLTVSNMLKEHGIKVRNIEESKRGSVDYKFFSNIDTEKKAYILGLLYADGTIIFNRKNKVQYSFSIGLKYSDRYLIEEIKRTINSDHKILDIKRHGGLGKTDTVISRLTVNNKTMYNDLVNLGMATKDTIPDIPNNLIHHFIRGIFDGDGCISVSGKYNVDMHIMGNESLLKEINSIIGFNEPKLIRNIYRIRKGGKNNARIFADYIYKDATIFLKRKREKFIAVLG